MTLDHVREGAYSVNVGGRVCPATLHTRAPFDPDSRRIRP